MSTDMGGEYELGYEAGMERAAEFVEECGHHPIARAIRTLKDGGKPCDDCGGNLPEHDPTCVARTLGGDLK